MTDYRALYFYLFGQIAAAVEELEQGKIVLAAERLIEAQKKAEEQAVEDAQEAEQ